MEGGEQKKSFIIIYIILKIGISNLQGITVFLNKFLILYCFGVLHNLQKVVVLQKKAIRIIDSKKKKDYVSDLKM